MGIKKWLDEYWGHWTMSGNFEVSLQDLPLSFHHSKSHTPHLTVSPIFPGFSVCITINILSKVQLTMASKPSDGAKNMWFSVLSRNLN